jgi:phosphoribosylformimino-5-aminoimidazole carboxamide ribonucleotide (ProFAR) isomerase
MQKIPALSIRKKKVVVTEGDEYIPVGEPVKILRDLEKKGYERFYIVDIEGIERNKIQIELIDRLASEFSIWLDGGFRDVGVIEDGLVLGAEIAVISSKSIKSVDEIRKAAELSDNLAFSVDYFNGILKWGDIPEDMEAISQILKSYGIKRVIFANLGDEEGAPVEKAMEIFRDFELWLAGNIPQRYESDERIEGMIIPYSKIHE